MLIDWFTVGAQVVNFGVLVVVLKLVLFDRVVAAMDKREAAIAERIQSAEDREAEARTEADSYRARQRQLDDALAARLADADAEAAARRQEMLDEARASVDELRAGWHGALRRDRAHLLDEVRRRAGEQVCAVSRRALADLADATLEAQLVDVAIRQLEREAERLQPLVAGSATAGEPVIVRSAFALDAVQAARVVEAIATRLGCHEDDIVLARDQELVCGLEISAAGWSAGWSIDGYLDAVVSELDALLPAGEVIDPSAGAGPIDEVDGARRIDRVVSP